MIMEAKHSNELCGLCATICKECANSCEMFKDDHCKTCAKICNECSKECEKMAKK
jgi:hypothetical protein